MKNMFLCRFLVSCLAGFIVLAGTAGSQEGAPVPAPDNFVREMLERECNNLDKEKLERLILDRYGEELSSERPQELLRIMEGVVKRTDFDDVAEEKTVEIIGLVHGAYLQGAPLEFLDDLFDVAYATKVSVEQLAAASKALQDFDRSEVPRDIYEEFVFRFLENRWDPAVLPVLTRGLIYGADRGLSPDKVALIIMLDMRDGERRKKGPDQLVLDAITLVREKEPSRWKPLTPADREAAVNQKRSADLARTRQEIDAEIRERERAFFQAQKELAVLREYPAEQRPAEAEQLSMDLERLIRKLQSEITQYQRKRGAISAALESAHSAVDRQQELRDRERRLRRQRELERAKQQVASRGSQGRLDRDRLLAVVNRYLGAPYRFGGDSVHGIDCSAFTRRVYREQGIELPRNSREQARVGRAVTFSNLRTGDLVFFNTSINGVISHVGVYLGNGVFAHASSSKGVTRSSIREQYYVRRFVKGGRIFSD